MEVGIGSGYQRQEFDGVGVNIEESRERFREATEVITKAWTEERLTFHGKYTNVDDIWVIPKPVQKPHPPLYVAISTSPSTVEWAARGKVQPILGGPTDIMGQATEVMEMWRSKMEEFGHEHAHLHPPVNKAIYVTPTMEEALNDPIGLDDFSWRILKATGSSGNPVGMPTDKDGNLPKGYEAWANRQRDRERRDDPGHAGLPPLRGTPDVIIERLKLVQEEGVERIFGPFGFPGLPQEKVLRSIELFCTQVLPHFREAPAPVPR